MRRQTIREIELSYRMNMHAERASSPENHDL